MSFTVECFVHKSYAYAVFVHFSTTIYSGHTHFGVEPSIGMQWDERYLWRGDLQSSY
jgi:hypothetical protein